VTPQPIPSNVQTVNSRIHWIGRQIGNIIFGDLIGNIFMGIKFAFNLMNDYTLQIRGITPPSIDGIQNIVNVMLHGDDYL